MNCECGHERMKHGGGRCVGYVGDHHSCLCEGYTERPYTDRVYDEDPFFGNDLIANISRGEEALKGIEPGATFDIEELFPTQ